MLNDQKKQSQRVNLSELLEVRSAGLATSEVLTILALSCDYLVRASNRRGLFTIEQIFLTRDGRIEIQLVQIDDITNQAIPPELLEQSQSHPSLMSDSHLVWCLGRSCLQVLIQENSEIALFSLLNLMTVTHVESRPSLQKVRQMVRNQMNVIDIGRMLDVISSMYEEVMGDLDLLIQDPFGDDIRFSSSRSSQLSIISGPVGQEYQRRSLDFDVYQQELVKNVAERLRRDFSLSKKHSQQTKRKDEEDKLTTVPFKQALCIPDNIQTQIQEPQSSPNEQLLFPTTIKLDEKIDEELTPRGLSPTMEHEKNNNYQLPLTITNYSPTRKKQILPSKMQEQQQQQMETKDEQEATTPQQQQLLHRQNSLKPGRCSRRASLVEPKFTFISKSATTKTFSAVPEFLCNNTQANIRLRAQSIQKKKMVTLHRNESATVFVRLLNGHNVEVNCKTDHLVGAIFHTVAEHLNITEHLFFGLVLQQQHGEHIFLEENHRLEKWAPPGWKNGAAGLHRSFRTGNVIREQFILHLRFRYYPKKREFVKTAITAHQLYLQLRQDILNGTLRFQLKKKALEVAALALCVECGQPPTGQSEYFKTENYLPSKFYDLTSAEILETRKEIMILHSQFAEHNMGRLEAEERFIELCQTEPFYGAHFYHIYKLKPKHGQQPFPSNIRLVAIMPSGIGICREERESAKHSFTSLHEWNEIRTLQFDRKRFLIGTVENGIAVDHVFYTDHHTKSSYLVRFAASQHRFMLKMRQWQGTINRVREIQRHKDVGIEQHQNEFEDERQQDIQQPQQLTINENIQFEEKPRSIHQRNTSQPQMGTGFASYNKQQKANMVINKMDDETWKRQSRLLNETDEDYIQYCYGPDAQRIEVVLEKNPDFGLGLTLVDGAVNGVKGVYIKSVSVEGDGRRKGLLIGDCLLSINGVSLFNRTRHDAVELVRNCVPEVHLEILRFPSISEVLAQDPIQNVLNAVNDKIHNSPKHENSKVTTKLANFQNTSSCKMDDDSIDTDKKIIKGQLEQEKQKESTPTNQNNTSAITQKPEAFSNLNVAQSRRQRALSDFGIFGGNLPVLRTDDLLAAVTPNKRRNGQNFQRYRRHKTSAGFPDSNLGTSDSEEEESTADSESGSMRETSQMMLNNRNEAIKNQNSAMQKGEYLPTNQEHKTLPPVSAMYGTLEYDEISDDDDDNFNIIDNVMAKQHYIGNKQLLLKTSHSASNSSSASQYNSPLVQTNNNNADAKYSQSGLQQSNLDWTNDISDVESTSNCVYKQKEK